MMNANTAREMTAKAIAEKEARMTEHAKDIVAWIERNFIKPAANNGKDATVVTSEDVHNAFYWEAELALPEAIEMLKTNGFEVNAFVERKGTVYRVMW